MKGMWLDLQLEEVKDRRMVLMLEFHSENEKGNLLKVCEMDLWTDQKWKV